MTQLKSQKSSLITQFMISSWSSFFSCLYWLALSFSSHVLLLIFPFLLILLFLAVSSILLSWLPRRRILCGNGCDVDDDLFHRLPMCCVLVRVLNELGHIEPLWGKVSKLSKSEEQRESILLRDSVKHIFAFHGISWASFLTL